MRHAFFAASDEALYLGPPRAQQAGESHHGATMFPPPPTTFQGMVRTRVLLHGFKQQVDLREPAEVARVIGPPEHLPPGWQLDGPWVAGVVTLQLPGQPAPRARLWPWVQAPWCARRDERGLRWCHAHPAGDVLFDREALPMWVDRGTRKEAGGWISAEGLWSLLSTGRASEAPRCLPPFVAAETRPGLRLDAETRTAERSMLYFRETCRLSGGVFDKGRVARAGFAATLELPDRAGVSPDALTRGAAWLGRRQRPLSLEPQPPPVSAWEDVLRGRHLDTPGEPDASYAWLILASPAPLDPGGRDGTSLRPRLEVAGVEVVAAVLPPPLVLGGLAAGSLVPKPNRAFLAPGSAWLLRLTSSDPGARQAALRALHHRCTLGAAAERTFGCGRTWVSRPFPSSAEVSS
jgi:hypothetical protein